jgi:hypothetical protein
LAAEAREAVTAGEPKEEPAAPAMPVAATTTQPRRRDRRRNKNG